MGTRTRMIALAAATAMALGGCSALGVGEDSSDSTSTATSGSSSSPTSGVVNGDTADSAKAAGIDLQNPPELIGSVTIEINKDRIESTKVELLQLRERGKVMLAVFRITPKGSTTETVSIYNALGDSSFQPWLLDLQNLKGYSSIEDLTTNDTFWETEMGAPLYAFTAFPIPDDGVEKVDVKILNNVPAIEGVPLP